MTDLHLHITILILIYITILIQLIFYKNNTKITQELIHFWFENCVILTENTKITRTSDLFTNYCTYTRTQSTKKQDLIIFGKLLKEYIKKERIPIIYKKGRYAGYTNIKALI